jgi:2-iminobutanoate/2-iminopropanoate deaminase
MKLLVSAILVAMLVISPAAFAGEPDVEYFPMPGDEALPFSEAVRVGPMLYLSGQIGLIPGTMKLADGGIAGETRQTMENIKATLEKLGSSMQEVVKCTVFLADIAQWDAMNAVYITYFPDHPPARSALASSGLALGALTEIECMASIK